MKEETSSHQRRLPKYRRKAEEFGPFRVTARDLQILDLVYRYRYVRAEHVLALIKGSSRQLARRLQGLFHHGYVARFSSLSKARMLEWGSIKMIYGLDRKGAAAVAELQGVNVAELAWRKDHTRRYEWFAEHQVAISDFHAALELACRRRGAVELAEWRQGADLRDWTEIKDQHGAVTRYGVAPDAYFALQEGEHRRNFFLEIDQGTEDYGYLRNKFEGYWWYLPGAPGGGEENYWYPNPKDIRVLVVCHAGADEQKPRPRRGPGTWSRVELMFQELGKLDPKKHRGLNRFWFTTQAHYTLEKPNAVLGPIWRTIDRENLSLME